MDRYIFGSRSNIHIIDLSQSIPLLHQAQVVGTPGSGFGPAGEGSMRLTACNTADNTREALERVLAVL